jgi:NAD-dependent deacetylase
MESSDPNGAPRPNDVPVTIPSALAAALHRARHVVALTGAGISAESGIPTFRETDGIWARFDPEEVATPRAFARDPAKVWGWYAYRRRAMAHAEPNPGHRSLAALERLVPEFTLVTQNIDGLHARAGSARLIELHGNIQRAKCFDCGRLADLAPALASRAAGTGARAEGSPATDAAASAVASAAAEEIHIASEAPPTCTECGGLMRPDVVWFGENLAMSDLHAAFDAASSADVCLSIGTSGLVEPAASLPLVALEGHARVVEINPEATPLTAWAHDVIQAPAGLALPALLAAAWPDADMATEGEHEDEPGRDLEERP